MGNFFSSLFSSSAVAEETGGISKSNRKKFDILKYDGIRAQKIGQLPYAIKCFTEALTIVEDFETMISLVGAYNQIHEPEKALDVLDRMVEIEPEQVDIRISRASVLLQLEKDEEAIDECQRIIDSDPTSYLTYFLMSRAKKNRRDLDGALDDATNAIGLNNDFADAYLLRAEILLKKADYLAALADAEQVIALVGDHEAACLMRGDLHVFLNNIPAAEENFNKVLELNPYNEDGALKLAALLSEAERLDEASVVLDDLIELSPALSKAYQLRGAIRKRCGDADGAADDLRKADEFSDELPGEANAENGQADFSSMYKGGIF